MTPADTIQVFNTTLRDGAQREGIKLCVEDSGDRAAPGPAPRCRVH